MYLKFWPQNGQVGVSADTPAPGGPVGMPAEGGPEGLN